MFDERWVKAKWIAQELESDPEDVYDVLLGNITQPEDLVNAVRGAESEYDYQKRRGLRQTRED